MSGEARGLGGVLAVFLAAHVARSAARARVVALRGLELAREGVDLVEALAALAPLEVRARGVVLPGHRVADLADVLVLRRDDDAVVVGGGVLAFRGRPAALAAPVWESISEHAIEQTASMAWGARDLISTQCRT